MWIWVWIAVVSSAILWLVVYWRVRFLERTIPSLDTTTPFSDPPDGWPFISVIVPARNEEKIIDACLRSLAAQDYPSFELIFVDDQSTDRTLELARAALRDLPSAQIIEGARRPSNDWVGKSWAVVQGAAHAKGPWLLFVDSDVIHHPSTFRRAMAKAIELRVDALSILPTIDCRSFWEKCVMPLFALLSVLIEPLDSANRPEKRASRLCGAFILITRGIYDAAGGHTAVHNQILEDMAFAEILKEQGRRIWLTYTRDLTSTRMYDSFRDLWTGLTRLSFPMLNYSPPLLGLAYLAALLGPLVPWLALLAGTGLAMRGGAAGWPLASAGVALCLFSRHAVERIFTVVKIRSGYAWLFPLASTLYCLAATYAAVRHFSRRGLPWKQRLYDARPTPEHPGRPAPPP